MTRTLPRLRPVRASMPGALAVAVAGGLAVVPPSTAAAAPFGPSAERLADVIVHGRGVVLGDRLHLPAQGRQTSLSDTSVVRVRR